MRCDDVLLRKRPLDRNLAYRIDSSQVSGARQPQSHTKNLFSAALCGGDDRPTLSMHIDFLCA